AVVPDATDAGTHLVAFTTIADADFNLSIANEDGSDPHVIFHGTFLSWSPSGQYMLVNDGKNRETVIDVTGKTIGRVPYGGVSWSPDDHILVTARAGNGAPTGRMSLYDVHGTLVRSYPALDGVDNVAYASWAPDGSEFVTAGCSGCTLGQPSQGWALW